ncbi:DUF397 domain-containing protein [Kitasatospora sp. NPDC056076]|uniref:DUF397 domain-containing protein n=1 Tax=Kitasatospora sp. NPDC056076 TaxID=3345703 RepID=UPI0035D8CA59
MTTEHAETTTALYAIDVTGLTRYKSPLSTNNDSCVELKDLPGGGRVVYDSKDLSRPSLRFGAAAWDALEDAIRDGLI